jgi:hypothetical protein
MLQNENNIIIIIIDFGINQNAGRKKPIKETQKH